ncbi:hypothetical protein [Geobacter sp. SVR]|uniref:hypothetical protein n=1 Tax=Geobacter sp. SVR TaxID=2495594 RepID=UPI00143EFFEF|nr:hypothetical protein [Geobacter sp. SVR]BCS53264.1 hypothetical protein GSVR_15720 [Geobacter sp. SVR]GCF84650.1 hypothetical protein GSbR_12500 [Geobacter sp. SVR]
MKKIAAWFVMLLLSACGMGGSTGTGSTASSASGVPNSTGKVEITIRENTAKSVAAAPAATRVRLVITNPNLNINGAPFKYIIDGTPPAGNKITGLKFPIANGYAFDLITYVPLPVGTTATTVNRMLKYARVSNVNVSATDTSIDLNLDTITAGFNFPTETVYSGATLDAINADLQKPTPLQVAWNLFLKTDATQVSSALHATSGQSAAHISVKVPNVLKVGTLYGQGEFYINSALLDTTGTLTIYEPTTLDSVPHSAEKNTSWTFNYPNPDFGDSIDLVKVPLDVFGGVSVNIPTAREVP